MGRKKKIMLGLVVSGSLLAAAAIVLNVNPGTETENIINIAKQIDEGTEPGKEKSRNNGVNVQETDTEKPSENRQAVDSDKSSKAQDNNETNEVNTNGQNTESNSKNNKNNKNNTTDTGIKTEEGELPIILDSEEEVKNNQNNQDITSGKGTQPKQNQDSKEQEKAIELPIIPVN